MLSIIFLITIEIRLVVIYFLLILDEARQDAENKAKQLVEHNGVEYDQASEDVHDPSKESGQFDDPSTEGQDVDLDKPNPDKNARTSVCSASSDNPADASFKVMGT